MSFQVFFVRHAKVIAEKGIIYGDDPHISSDRETLEKAQILANMLPSPQKALWVTSGVCRTIQTSELVLRFMESHESIGTSNSIIHTPLFKEQNFGQLIGSDHTTIQAFGSIDHGRLNIPNPPGGERHQDVINRASDAISWLRKMIIQRELAHAVVFTHGGWIRAVRCVCENLHVAHYIDYETEYLSVYKQFIKQDNSA